MKEKKKKDSRRKQTKGQVHFHGYAALLLLKPCVTVEIPNPLCLSLRLVFLSFSLILMCMI